MNIPVILKELAKVGVVALTEESVKSFAETKIKPIFVNWGKEETRSIELEECLSEYLLRCYAKNDIMTTIVFGRVQKTLEDLYIPLTLEEYKCEKDKSKKDEWVINETCYDILNSYSRILIVDMAGMGKSTIVKYFACQGVNLDKSVPIVIELRRLEKNKSILEYIQTQINSYDKNIEISEIIDILKKGDFVVFFDGYDEVANENKPDVLNAIQEFTSKATNTKIVITSRDEDDLNSLGEYKCVNIKPLVEEEAYELIEKYDNDGKISKKLIKRLKADSSMGILKEFLENPLLVSLLYKTFEYKEEIPYKKIDFYEQVYTALFNDHDKTKGSAYVHEKKTKLDRFQFEQILRTFAFLSLKTDKVGYSSQIIHQLLNQSIERFGWLKVNVYDFLYDITHAVPFIQKDGNEYKWVHKSFMEYFASCFICYDNKEFEQKYFKKMISSNFKKYFNILDFCYDLDMLSFRRYIILPYLDSYIYRYENTLNDKYFDKIENRYLDLTRRILSIAKNIEVSSSLVKDFTEDSLLGDYDENRITNTSCFGKWRYKICYSIFNSLLSQLLVYKIPSLYTGEKSGILTKLEIYTLLANLDENFEETDNDEWRIYQHEMKFKLDDNINNPIFKDYELFVRIIDDLYDSIYSSGYKLVNDEVCKMMINEIRMECNFACGDLFEL